MLHKLKNANWHSLSSSEKEKMIKSMIGTNGGRADFETLQELRKDQELRGIIENSDIIKGYENAISDAIFVEDKVLYYDSKDRRTYMPELYKILTSIDLINLKSRDEINEIAGLLISKDDVYVTPYLFSASQKMKFFEKKDAEIISRRTVEAFMRQIPAIRRFERPGHVIGGGEDDFYSNCSEYAAAIRNCYSYLSDGDRELFRSYLTDPLVNKLFTSGESHRFSRGMEHSVAPFSVSPKPSIFKKAFLKIKEKIGAFLGVGPEKFARYRKELEKSYQIKSEEKLRTANINNKTLFTELKVATASAERHNLSLGNPFSRASTIAAQTLQEKRAALVRSRGREATKGFSL